MQYVSKLSFLERIFGKYKYHSNTHEAEFFSPFVSHHKPKLSINLETDRWQCWVSGHNGKKLLYPMREAGATREQLQQYMNLFGNGKKHVSVRYSENIGKMYFPESFVPLVSCNNSVIGKKAFNYLLNRGLNELDILRFKIGICTKGQFEGRIIFPSFDKKGELNFYTGRAYDGHYLNVSVPKGYKNSIILNEINIDWEKPVVITEGFIDAFKSISNTVPVFGSFLHHESLLFETAVEQATEVVMAFDKDAWRKQDSICKKFLSYDVPVSVIELTKNDLGEQTKEEGLALFENRVPWTQKGSFLRRLNAL